MLIKEFPDLEFTVTTEHPSVEHEAQFTIYDVVGRQSGGVPVYQNWTTKTTTDIKNAEVFARCYIKWDGCSDWHLIEDDCMVHGCCRSDLERIGKILVACWDWMAEICTNWNPD
jgi:hypothetical protein